MNSITLRLGLAVLCLCLPVFLVAQLSCGIYERPDNPGPSTIVRTCQIDRSGNFFTEKELLVKKYSSKRDTVYTTRFVKN